jgi:branched-chain amino acid transport system ATP-binding protein
VLEVRSLTKRFGGFAAVSSVSFRLEQNEILGLIGPNGSGKSTTFNVISGLYAPSEGSVRFFGDEIGRLGAAAVCHRGIARTFQIPRPFRKLSLLDNVALAAFYGHGEHPARDKAYALAREALDLVGLASGPSARVDGLGAAGLKKLELARALATQPKLLLADESLGGLDEHEMDQAADLLAMIRRERGITIIWVEHIMGALMRVVDRCIVLDHGEVIAAGKPEEVAHDAKVIEVYLGTDAQEVQRAVAARPS